MAEEQVVAQETMAKSEEEAVAQDEQSAGEEQSSAPDVKQEVETPEKDPRLFDEDGVLWKNRAKENERKYHQTLEKFANFQKTPAQPAPDDSEEIPATRGGVKQVLSELTREEAQAEQTLNEVIDELSAVRPEIATLRTKIEQQLKTVDVSQRKNPGLIKAVAFAIYGEENFTKKPEPVKQVVKKLVNNAPKSDVLSSSPQGGNMSESKLTEEEEEYAFSHRLKEKGFDNDEIHDLFSKVHKKR